MESYVDYEFYINTYKGSKITSKEEFDKLSLRATQYVKEHIFNRDYSNYCGNDFTNEVKYATCSLTEIEQEYQKGLEELSSGNIKSESIGDYSRSFGTKEELIKNTNQNRIDELKLYLATTGLLFRGLDHV